MKKIIVAFFALLMVGCSNQFAYNNLDFVVNWYLDDYVELNSQQQEKFDEAFTRLWKWHRSEELIKYQIHLNEFRQDLNSDALTAEQLAKHFARGREHWTRLKIKLAPELVSIASSLTAEQAMPFFDDLDERQQERAKKRAKKDNKELSHEEKMAQRVEDISDNFSSNIGKLSKKQKDIIASYAPKFKSTQDMHRQYRLLVQQKARALFEQESRGLEFQQQLTDLIIDPDQYKTPLLIENSNNNSAIYAELMLELVQTLNKKQKRKVFAEIDDWLDDLADLIEKKETT